MFRVAIVFVFASMVALGFAGNTKCSGEIETFRKCREFFGKSLKASHQKEQADRQDKVKQCFTSSGCKEPIANGTSSKVKVDDKKKQCFKDFSKSIHDLIKPCVQKKLDVILQEEDYDNTKRGPSGLGDLHDELKSFCTSDDQRNKTKACLKSLFESGKNASKDIREKKGEEIFNANCGNKRECLAKVSSECQTILNKTKSARCDCAKSDVAPKSDALNQQLQSCIGGTPKPDKDGKKDSFIDHLVKNTCEIKDKCSKPYQPHSAEHRWKGKGKQGNGKGKNHH